MNERGEPGSRPQEIYQKDLNDPESPNLTRRGFLSGAVILAIAARSAPEILNKIEELTREKPLPPYTEYDGFLEAWRQNAATISIHEADEQPESSELVLNYPEIYIPEINVSRNYGKLFSTHNDYDVDYMSLEEKKWRDLEHATQRYVDAGVTTIEFDSKLNLYDYEGFTMFRDFLKNLKGSRLRIIVTGTYNFGMQLVDEDDDLPTSLEALPHIISKSQLDDYKSRMDNDELPPNIGATSRYGSSHFRKILNLNNQLDRPKHPTKIWDVQDEQNAAGLMNDGATIIGTDRIRFHDRVLQLT